MISTYHSLLASYCNLHRHQQKRQLSEANFLSCVENWHTNISNVHRFFFLSNLKVFSRAKRKVWNFGIIKINHLLHTVRCFQISGLWTIQFPNTSFFNNSGSKLHYGTHNICISLAFWPITNFRHFFHWLQKKSFLSIKITIIILSFFFWSLLAKLG